MLTKMRWKRDRKNLVAKTARKNVEEHSEIACTKSHLFLCFLLLFSSVCALPVTAVEKWNYTPRHVVLSASAKMQLDSESHWLWQQKNNVKKENIWCATEFHILPFTFVANDEKKDQRAFERRHTLTCPQRHTLEYVCYRYDFTNQLTVSVASGHLIESHQSRYGLHHITVSHMRDILSTFRKRHFQWFHRYAITLEQYVWLTHRLTGWLTDCQANSETSQLCRVFECLSKRFITAISIHKRLLKTLDTVLPFLSIVRAYVPFHRRFHYCNVHMLTSASPFKSMVHKARNGISETKITSKWIK